MADTTARVQQWRQRLKDEGKEALTVYITHEEKLRLEDLAQTWHCSISTLVEQALAAFRPGNPTAPGPAADTAHVRALIREELAHLLPPELRTFLGSQTSESFVTETLLNIPVTNAPQLAVMPPKIVPEPAAQKGDHLRVLASRHDDTQEELVAGGHESALYALLAHTQSTAREELPSATQTTTVHTIVLDTHIPPQHVSDITEERPAPDSDALAYGETLRETRSEFEAALESPEQRIWQTEDIPVAPPAYDTSKYVLGKLCPRGHDYQSTGKTLLRLPKYVCPECDAERARERRQAKRQKKPA